MIDDILHLSKAEAGKLEVEDVAFSLSELVERVIELTAPRAVEKGLELELKTGGGVPEWVRGESSRVQQVLLNLAGNAVKFTKSGRVTLLVDRAPGEEIRFRPQPG